MPTAIYRRLAVAYRANLTAAPAARPVSIMGSWKEEGENMVGRAAITRREFRGGVAAWGVVGAAGCAAPSAAGRAGTTGRLPERGEYLIRGAYVMTMDAAAGDSPNANVHVRDGAIVAVG